MAAEKPCGGRDQRSKILHEQEYADEQEQVVLLGCTLREGRLHSLSALNPFIIGYLLRGQIMDAEKRVVA